MIGAAFDSLRQAGQGNPPILIRMADIIGELARGAGVVAGGRVWRNSLARSARPRRPLNLCRPTSRMSGAAWTGRPKHSDWRASTAGQIRRLWHRAKRQLAASSAGRWREGSSRPCEERSDAAIQGLGSRLNGEDGRDLLGRRVAALLAMTEGGRPGTKRAARQTFGPRAFRLAFYAWKVRA